MGFEPQQQCDVGWRLISSASWGAWGWDLPHGKPPVPRRWSSNKNSEHQILKEFPVWQYPMCTVTHRCQEGKVVLTPWREDNWKFLIWNFSWAPPYSLLLLAGLKLHPFPAINHNHKNITAFSERLHWIFFSKLSNLKVVLGKPELTPGIRSEVILSGLFCIRCCRAFHRIRDTR